MASASAQEREVDGVLGLVHPERRLAFGQVVQQVGVGGGGSGEGTIVPGTIVTLDTDT